jgi:hypothetical protein
MEIYIAIRIEAYNIKEIKFEIVLKVRGLNFLIFSYVE